jgi:hypothetical protein
VSTPDWPGTPGFPAFPFRKQYSRKSLQLPFATLNSEADAPEVIWGTGSPEGVIVGSPGDIFIPVDAADGSIWKKKTGVETNTGWTQITGQASVGGGGSGSGSGSGFSPGSPFVGHVSTFGTAGPTPALVHLLMPSSPGGKLLAIYELMVGFTNTGAGVLVRRTSSPISLHGGGETIVSANPLRLDERDVVGVQTEFAGTNKPGGTFTEAQSQFAAKMSADSASGWVPTIVRPAGGFPWIAKPGSAIELLSDTGSATIGLRVWAVWDEITIPA